MSSSSLRSRRLCTGSLLALTSRKHYDPRATGTDRLSFIPIRSSEHIRFYQAFYAIIFDAAELSHGPNYSGGLLW
jgi:hypothetical protein